MPETRFRGFNRDTLGLVLFVVLCLTVAGIGGTVTATTVETWYPTLRKPWFNPPNWLFAPVWTALYLLMAIAAWRVWRHPRGADRKTALIIFAAQLALNLAWSFIFFGLRQIGLALIEICVLLVVILANTVLFWRIDRLAGRLFVPYVLWVVFAASLNASLWLLN